MAKLELFYMESCPYCIKVFNYLKDKKDNLILKDINKDKKAAKELVKVGGKRQVPCLFIDGKPLYESDDIIQWFKDNLGNNK